MKKQAICIQCHNCPDLINLLISRFPPDSFDFFIHADSKCSIVPQLLPRPNVRFVPRIDVRWGRFSQVQATLNLLEALDAAEYSRVHLISGNDFPLRTAESFLNFFENNPTEYIQSHPLPEKSHWIWGGEDRYCVYYPQWLIERPSHRILRVLRIAYREFVMRTGFLKKKHFPIEKFYGGSQWFSLTGDCIAWMKDYLHGHPEYIRFFRHGACVDEIFFQTLVRQSPFADRVKSNSLRYIVWEDHRLGSPKTLGVSDVPAMLASNQFFARKICDMSVVESICQQLDS